MVKNGNLLLLTIIVMMSACSTVRKPSGTEDPILAATQAEQDSEVKVSLKEAEVRLDQLVGEAHKAGDDAIRFLSDDLYLKATDSSIRGDSHTAAFLYKYVVALNPKDVYVQKKYAIELIRNGELESSEKLLSDLFKAGKYKDESVGLILGGIYTALEKPEAAKKTYLQVIQYNKKSEEACVFLAKAWASDKKFKKAINQLTACEKQMKGRAIFAYYKGRLELSRERKKAAAKHFKAALKVDPEYYQAVLGLGVLKEEKEDYAAASQVYSNYLKKDPENYSVLTRLVQVLFVLGDFKAVIPHAERLSSLDPSDLNLKVKLGILYTDAGRYEEAKSIFREILVEVPSSDKILFYLGSLYQQTGHLNEAVEFFNRIPDESGLFLDGNLQIGQILQVQAIEEGISSNAEGVDKFLTFVDSVSEKYEPLKMDLGLLKVGYFEDVQLFDKAIKGLVSLKEAQGYNENHDYYLASLYEKAREPQLARAVILEVLEKNPENAHALNFLGYSLLENGEDSEKALEYISRAVSLKPKDGYIRDSLGWYYYKMGMYEKALGEIKKAFELVKTDVVITKHLAMAYQALKNYNKAQEFYVEALKHCRFESERADVMRAMKGLEDKIRLPASSKGASVP